MKGLKIMKHGRLQVLITILFIAGCVSEPVKTELPIDHPANSQAPEATFIEPPNPFNEYTGAAVGMESDANAHMPHNSPDEPHGQMMNHQKDQLKKSESSVKSTPEKTVPEHKEHHQ